MAIQWNRHDIAKDYIFTGEENFELCQLFNLLEISLIENKPKFVELLVDLLKSNINSFLTYRRIMFLYNSHKLRKYAKRAPIFQLFKQRYLPKDKSNSYLHLVTFKGIKHFLRDSLFEDFKAQFIVDIPVKVDGEEKEAEDEDAEEIQKFIVIYFIFAVNYFFCNSIYQNLVNFDKKSQTYCTCFSFLFKKARILLK